MDIIEDSKKAATEQTLLGLGVDYDESVPKGRVAIHPETFNNLWINTKIAITLKVGKPSMRETE